MMANFWVFLLIQVFSTFADEEPHVKVEEGLLMGKWMTSRSGQRFMGFLKVPYAAPPVGELRFEVPQEPKKWIGVWNATEDGAHCVQRDIYVKGSLEVNGEEDCLYLNVYTPRVNITDELLPVMVYIHGGGWVTGSGNSKHYSPDYLLDKDIVLVTIQYRLGPLGFLSMEDDELPGNLGLKDQVQSLIWVRKNIKSFGGNPDLVTIFGESAGGASVHYHVLSPMSRGLFHRAISQSGTATCAWALGEPGVTRKNTVRLAESLRCPSEPTRDLVKCLRGKPSKDILMTDTHFLVWNKNPIIPFKPVVEKSAGFITEPPEETIKSGQFANVPMMMGLNSAEGALAPAAFIENETLMMDLDQRFTELIPVIFFLNREKVLNVTEAARQIRSFYFGDKSIDKGTVNELVDLYSDGWFLSGTHEAVTLTYNRSTSPVYYYYFSYRGSASFSTLFPHMKQDLGTWHTDDLIYLFPMRHLLGGGEFSEKDKEFMQIFLKLWTNFARTGDPTPDGEEPFPEKWMPVRSDNLEYLHLAGEGPAMAANLLRERTAFWSQLKKKAVESVSDMN